MTQSSARRLAFALALCASTLGSAAFAHAQTTAPKGVSPNGVTGTDPCPKNYICTVNPPPQAVKTTGSTPSTTTPTSASVMGALLTWLGLS